MCLQVCKGAKHKWYIDSGCSCHMTGSKSLLSSFKSKRGATISFGNKRTGKVIGLGNSVLSELVKFLEISLVEDLKFNLLSVSQLCEQGNNHVTFTTKDVSVFSPTNELLFKGIRSGGTYIFYHDYVPTKSLCLASLSEQSTLWHQRMGHASLHLLHRLEKKNLVRGLPIIKPQDMTSCSECSKGKQTRASFPQSKLYLHHVLWISSTWICVDP